LPIYDVSAAAEALDLTPKQLDNIICRHAIPGVDRARRGVTRRLSSNAIVVLRLACELADALGLPISRALRVALDVEQRNAATIQLSKYATLSIDLAALRAMTSSRLDAAVESVGRRRRGRPPGRPAR